MRNLSTFLIACFIGLSSLTAQNVIFSDDFQTSGFPTGYTLYDVDGNTVNSQIAAVFPSAWNRLQFTSTPGEFFIASTSWYSPADTANDWVVTPSLSLTSNNYLFFKMRSGNSSAPDGFQVKLSTTTNAVDSFNVNLMTVSATPASWTTYAIDLSAYANQTVYLAWINNTYDGYIAALDDIIVTEVLNGDAQLSEIDIPEKTVQNTAVTIRGEYMHLGNDTLNSIDINWSANGGPVKSMTSTGFNLTYGQSRLFIHDSTFTASAAGNFDTIDVWLSNPNGSIDPNTSNDSLQSTVLSTMGNGVQRNVLFEEFTTAECVYCPDGHVVMANILAQNSNVIPVSVHSCFYQDAMTNQEALDLCSTLGSGSAPSGMVDRIHYDGEAYPAHSRSFWQTRVNARSQVQSTANISATGTYDTLTKAVSIDVDVNFVDYELPGDIRLSLILVEDSMSGPSGGTPGVNRWNQRNAYNNSVGHPMYGKGDPIVGYIHRHVLRDILPSTWGDATVIPTNIVPNTLYSKTFNFTLNNSYKENDMSFVAVVSYKGNSTDEYVVINAKEIYMGDLVTSIEDIKSTLMNSFNIYPNPSQNVANMELTLTENLPLDITVYDITGKAVINKNYGEMIKGDHKLPINVSALSNGFYIMKVQVGEEVLSQKISVNR